MPLLSAERCPAWPLLLLRLLRLLHLCTVILLPTAPTANRTNRRYIEQFDTHNPQATVREALLFSARLRLAPSMISRSEIPSYVSEVMQIVELGPLADTMVGWPGNGLSTEARKRLTIAVELVANPSVIFMDEPTSGARAADAMAVVAVVSGSGGRWRDYYCSAVYGRLAHTRTHAHTHPLPRYLLLYLDWLAGCNTVHREHRGAQHAQQIMYCPELPDTLQTRPLWRRFLPSCTVYVPCGLVQASTPVRRRL